MDVETSAPLGENGSGTAAKDIFDCVKAAAAALCHDPFENKKIPIPRFCSTHERSAPLWLSCVAANITYLCRVRTRFAGLELKRGGRSRCSFIEGTYHLSGAPSESRDAALFTARAFTADGKKTPRSHDLEAT